MNEPVEIRDVSDTAIWVAYYRARETERRDAMFRDPLAKELVGARGEQFARLFGRISRYTEWVVVTRTVHIDDYILEGIRNGVDAVLNLGAGLDTRPYRMELPPDFKWVEADFPNLIQFKNEKLASHTPRCQLQRVSVDLADDAARSAFLGSVLPEAKKVLVLTEGVVPYLTEEQVAKLADDLHASPRYAFWLAEYLSPLTYRFYRGSSRMKTLARAPFQFFPPDWIGFFASHGWKHVETRHATDITRRFKRRPPVPWWARLVLMLVSKERREQMNKMSGFMLMARSSP